MATSITRTAVGLTILVATVAGALPAMANRPIPVGTAQTRIEYDNGAGPVIIQGNRDFSGVGPVSATLLGDNVKTFNSHNTFGRRTALANSQPMFEDVLGDNETLISHAFFKDDISGDYFPGITNGNGNITFSMTGMVFDRPVSVADSTLMLHTLWNPTQVQDAGLAVLYDGAIVHNHHTDATSFRDFDDFIAGGTFSDFPADNFTLDTIETVFLGDGTPGSPLSLTVTIPYSIYINLVEDPQNPTTVPDGFPAPGGFLEPFHFHFEYVVVPEPSSLALVGTGLFLARRRIRRSK